MNYIEAVKDILFKYDYKINKEYMDEGTQIILIDQAIINIKDKNIVICFEATTIPEDVANTIIILNKINGINITVSESFIINSDDEVIQGDLAFKFIKDTVIEKESKKIKRENGYKYLLDNIDEMDCYSC